MQTEGAASLPLANEFAPTGKKQQSGAQECNGLCLRSPRGEWPKKRL